MLRESLTVPANIALTASPLVVVIVSPRPEARALPTGRGNEYSLSRSEVKSTVKVFDLLKSPGVGMLICAFSAGVKSSASMLAQQAMSDMIRVMMLLV